ncbi:hypothetical protein FSP39_008587 [Pinctada imbricata]|uniref:Centrosomal protein kizuna n=1 Tax=Pinctada imbricata TaxID=66713 RepID=A0AA88Y2T1_PINIB|nr:hypothetical protein FSP39_008587 [Pinctada imbricata]
MHNKNHTDQSTNNQTIQSKQGTGATIHRTKTIQVSYKQSDDTIPTNNRGNNTHNKNHTGQLQTIRQYNLNKQQGATIHRTKTIQVSYKQSDDTIPTNSRGNNTHNKNHTGQSTNNQTKQSQQTAGATIHTTKTIQVSYKQSDDTIPTNSRGNNTHNKNHTGQSTNNQTKPSKQTTGATIHGTNNHTGQSTNNQTLQSKQATGATICTTKTIQISLQTIRQYNLNKEQGQQYTEQKPYRSATNNQTIQSQQTTGATIHTTKTIQVSQQTIRQYNLNKQQGQQYTQQKPYRSVYNNQTKPSKQTTGATIHGTNNHTGQSTNNQTLQSKQATGATICTTKTIQVSLQTIRQYNLNKQQGQQYTEQKPYRSVYKQSDKTISTNSRGNSTHNKNHTGQLQAIRQNNLKKTAGATIHRTKTIQVSLQTIRQNNLNKQQGQRYTQQKPYRAKLRATKLQTYWKKICEDQRRSHLRNQQILRDFERVDSHLATLTAKTERLRLLKRQYEEYIERTYPQWRQQVMNYGQQQQQTYASSQMKSSVYANYSEVTRDTDVTHYMDSMRQRTPSPQVTPHPSPTPVRLTAERDTGIGHQNDISASEDLGDVGMSQPIQSITVKGPGIPSPMRDVESPGVSQSSGQMEPELDDGEDDDEDETSLQSSPDEDEVPQIKASVQPKAARPSPSPELTTHGIIRLIRHVQNDFPHALSLEGYYRSHPPTPANRLEFINKANIGQNLDGLDGVMVSMVILEQVTLVIRSLRNKCLLPESILAGNIESVTQAQIRAMLLPDAQPLWDCLFDHLVKLVRDKVMVTNEVAAVFVPCIVSDRSDHQDKAFSLLMRLINEQVEGKSELDLPTPREGLDSITRSSLGGVPPLKFGSLVERQYSDDDTSQLTQSVTSAKIPLNATEAYRSMLSGSVKQQAHHIDDEEEDTDEDVEKQFASTLSPRESSSGKPTPRSTAGTVKTPRSTTQPQRKPGIHIQSDLDTDTEIDILKQQPGDDQKEDDFFDFYE